MFDEGIGTSPELTEESATPAFESLLFDEKEPKDNETPPAQESPEPAAPPAEVKADPEPAETDEGESEETEQTEQSEQAPQTFTVKVNGEDVQVTLEELQKGYSRTKDYTQKTQEIAERRKAFEAEAAAVVGERQQVAQYLKQLEQVLTEVSPKEPDWAKLQMESPEEFPLRWAEWQQREKDLAAVSAERQRAEAVVAQDYADQMKKHLESEKDKLVAAIPGWSEEKVAKAEKAQLVAYAKDIGFTTEQLEQITDHRALVMLHKAMKFDELQAKKPVVQQRIDKVKTATPGPSSQARPPVSDTTRALQRLAKTGKQADAAAAFLTMLSD